MPIVNSTPEDIPVILDLYDQAIAYQKKVASRYWLGFDKKLIETEVAEHRQWKLVIDGQIACIFVITWNDASIWAERDLQPSLYLHRIVTNPEFRGGAFVKEIVNWARAFCVQHNRKFIRLDTFGDNEKLIAYYEACGFTYLGLTTLGKRPDLPKHYEGTSLALLEIGI
jgi:RimJ/RimL family protein N-acetyltransferase